MEIFKNIFVIVKQLGSKHDFFQDGASIVKSEMDLKCELMNSEANEKFKKNAKKKNLFADFEPLPIYGVMSLDDAISKYEDIIVDEFIDEE